MGKKKASPKRAASKRVKSPRKRTSRHVEMLLEMSQEERSSFFCEKPSTVLLRIFEESYSSEIVNLLLDLKKSEVRQLFERLVAVRKRSLVPAITLYQYKEYLTNPLPLTISSTIGETVPNYYAILGMPRESTEEELREAHRLLTRALAPDEIAPPARKASGETLKEINEAYGALKSPKKREEADTVLPNISYLYPRRDQSWLEAVKRFID